MWGCFISYHSATVGGDALAGSVGQGKVFFGGGFTAAARDQGLRVACVRGVLRQQVPAETKEREREEDEHDRIIENMVVVVVLKKNDEK